MEIQVRVDGVGRVDLLIDGWLAVEVDGYTWHSTREQIEEDRRRDAAVILHGKRYHRFGHTQVMHDLEGCIAVLRELLAAGRPVV